MNLHLPKSLSQISKSQAKSLLFYLIIILIVLFTFALRIHDLDGQSLWNDEGLSVFRARQSVSTILSNVITIDGVDTRDTNPPLYFLLLHWWREVAGETVFALRYISVLLAVLNIPLFYQLGKLIFNRYVGLVAAFLLALSPFHVWMSQEMRNYSLLLLLNMLSIYGLFHFALERNNPKRWRWLLLWSSAGVAGIYSHYFGVFIFGFGVLVVLAESVRSRKWRPSRNLIILLIAIALISLPVLWMGLSRFQAGRQIDFRFVPFHHLMSHAASAYAVGTIYAFVQPLWRVVPAVVLAAMGTILGWQVTRRAGKPESVPLILGYMLVPIVFLFALSAINPLYNGPRHLLIGLPGFLLLVAAGIALPWSTKLSTAKTGHGSPQNGRSGKFASAATFYRALAGLLTLWMLLSQGDWLNKQFTSPSLVKDDLHGLAVYLDEVGHADDLIILHDTIIGITFDYYYQGDTPWIAVPLLWQQDTDAAIERMRAAGDTARRVWFVDRPTPRTGFPPRLLNRWVSEQWPKLLDGNFASLWLDLGLEAYVPQPAVEQLPSTAAPANVSWDEDLLLTGYELPLSAQSGANWQPILYWQKLNADDGGYNLSIRLVDEQGIIWAQIDKPLWASYPPNEWPDEAIIRYEPVFSLPAGIPPGDYQVQVRLTRDDNRQPLTTDGEIEYSLSPGITIEAATYPDAVNRLPSNTAVETRLGQDIELLGYHLPDNEYRPGHLTPIDLYWRVHRRPAADYQLHIQLVDDQGQQVATSITSPTRAAYPPSQWKEGELLHGQANLIVPATAEAGRYQVTAALLHPETGEPAPSWWPLGNNSLNLGEIEVVPWPLETQFPAISNPLRADFGQPPLVEMHGYDLSDSRVSAGDILDMTLFWRSVADDIPTSYTAFVHLTDDAGALIAQGDGIPVAGFRPTNSWRTGEVIADSHVIQLPAEIENGSYSIWIGLYDYTTGIRLPILFDNQHLLDDRLLLQSIHVD